MTASVKDECAVAVKNIVKVFGGAREAVTALDNVSLETTGSEFFTLLGPSGCGKTTLLRIIAGFEDATQGEVLLYGDDIRKLQPNKRPVNTVFQHYALFPHMSIAENVAFGLRRQKHSETHVKRRVEEMLDLVQLGGFATRLPEQLSGGQQQRVALARALAPNPKVLLLDEPLSALDLKLRQAMRVELKQLQQNTGITFIFVTHDQEEALTMSDRMAVMSNGEVRQVGTPEDIYERPANRFVADFIGDTNLLPVTVNNNLGDGDSLCTTSHGVQLVAHSVAAPAAGVQAYVSIRPEKLTLLQADANSDFIPCTVERFTYLGTDTLCVVRLDDGSTLTVRNQNAHGSTLALQPEQRAWVRPDTGAARLLVD